MKNSESWAQGFGRYEQLRAMEDMRYYVMSLGLLMQSIALIYGSHEQLRFMSLGL